MTKKQELSVEITKEVDGLEMGVLEGGTPFLSMRGLSKLCGIANSTISENSKAWLEGKRDTKLAQFLIRNGVAADSLYVRTEIPGVAGNVTYAFPDHVCTLILEYYAFEVANPTEQAQSSYRTIARAGLRLFIFTALGYDPNRLVPQPWKEFHDRVTLASAPVGYFSIFKETADFVIGAIRGGLQVDSHTVPDISVGKAWSSHWDKNGLASVHGERMHHDHNYPDYFPQAASNPQPIWVYPLTALGEFRIWMQRQYAPNHFPVYLQGKVRRGALPASTAQVLAIQALSPAPANELT
jgi:hypothetical protein